jgi:hypothetical protein
MLALLLVAGVPLVGPSSGTAQQIQAVERIVAVLAPSDEAAGEWHREAKADQDRFDGGDGPDPILVPQIRFNLVDQARFIRIGCDFQPNAPPSHRPCAAPPTGPPLV